MKQSFQLFGLVAMVVVFMSASTLSKFNMTTPESAVNSARQFQFNYTGEVFPGEGIMPLVGQLSKDGGSLYITSQSAQGKKQLYKMNRRSVGADFAQAIKLEGELNSGKYDIITPSVSADENTMVFVHSVNGMQKGNDLYVATLTEEGTYGNVTPLTAANDPNLSDSYPWLSADGLRVYFTKQFGSDIKFYITERSSTSEPFGEAKELGLTLPKVSNNMSCQLSNDESELYALSGNNIYYSKLDKASGKFSVPVEIANSASGGYMSGITMTSDAKEMYVFNSIGFRNTQILRFVNSEKTMTAPTLSVPKSSK